MVSGSAGASGATGLLPNLLILGAARAGTTSLYRYLGTHPAIYMSPVKEPNFFAFAGRSVRFTGPGDEGINRRTTTRLEDYRALFAGAGPASVRGEASTVYLYHPEAARRIAEQVPGAKLVVVLRDPVERAYSAYLHLRRAGREPLASFADALAAEPARIAAGWQHFWHYAAMGFYAGQLEAYLERFPRAQLRVLRFEDFARDPRRALSELAAFLGVEDRFAVEPGAEHRSTAVPRGPLAGRLLAAGRRLERWVPPRLRPRLARGAQSLLATRPPLAPEVRSALAERYRDELPRLERLLGWDLSGWLRPAAAPAPEPSSS
jgi:hypothetical protein